MRLTRSIHQRVPILLRCSLTAAIATSTGLSQAETAVEEVIVMGKAVYGNSLISEAMQQQQSSMTSINAVIDNLPGVSVHPRLQHQFI